MNYFPFHIGDYESATMHLSWDEDLAYRRLMNSYYKREAPLPSDIKQIYRLVLAASKTQKAAVHSVLTEFFILTEAGYWHERCEEVIEKFKIKTGKAKASAEKRWGTPNAPETHQEIDADAMPTHSEGNAPNPINQEPIKKEDEYSSADDWDKLRDLLCEAAGWNASRGSGKLEVVGPIAMLIKNGAVLDMDVLPVIRRDAPKCSSPNWNYFTNAIAQARDNRLAASKLKFEPQPNGASYGKPKTNSIAGSFEIIRAALDAEGAAIQEEKSRLGISGTDVEILPRLQQNAS